MWRLAERLREFRGDAHVAAFAAAAAEGFDGCEIQLLTERCADMPRRTYVMTRGWSEDDLVAAEARLESRGLVVGGEATRAGRMAREEVEQLTDRACRPMIDALDDDAVELVRTLQAWGAEIRAADGYHPSSPQEALMDNGVQEWMTGHGLPRFAGADVHRELVATTYATMR